MNEPSQIQSHVVRFAQVLWDYHRFETKPMPSDVILGLGSYDIRVADHCAELYRSGTADRIVFSGAWGNWTRDLWQQTEAETFAERAAKCGVPLEKIVCETKATNIGENLRLSKALLQREGYPAGRVTLVTKPNTLRRAYATSAVEWPESTFAFTCPILSLRGHKNPARPLDEIIHEMVGDLQRILEYPKLGYQIVQEVPGNVIQAYKELIAMGYTNHLIVEA